MQYSAILLFTASEVIWIENGVAGFHEESNAGAEGCARSGHTVLGKFVNQGMNPETHTQMFMYTYTSI